MNSGIGLLLAIAEYGDSKFLLKSIRWYTSGQVPSLPRSLPDTLIAETGYIGAFPFVEDLLHSGPFCRLSS